MDNCCVKKIKEMHDLVDYTWWFQMFVLSSPFILLIPDLDPTSGKSDLVQSSIQKCSEMGFGIAMNHVNKNKSLPDFVDAVKAIEKIKYDRLRLICVGHMRSHALREKHIANFWNRMAVVYDNAFFAK